MNHFSTSTTPKTVLKSLVQILLALFLCSSIHAQTAKFLGIDRVTQGGWKGVYGTDGHDMHAQWDSVVAPPYGSWTITGLGGSHLWEGYTFDVRALQKANLDNGARIAPSWFSSGSFDFNLTFTDGQPHRVSLYCLDWENYGRSQKVEIRSALTDELLDSRDISAFDNGAYMRWNISGNVKLRVITTNPSANAVATAIFFDPPTQDPLWWSTGVPPVIDPAAEHNNHGVANIGQAKWMAKSALAALREKLPDAADEVEAELVGIIASWDPPVTPEEEAELRAPLLIGQLKAISAPFYNQLHDTQSEWLAGERTNNGTNQLGTHLPWTLDMADDGNRSVAQVGQLKAVFSLRFETLVILSLDPEGDPDLDGLTNAQEALLGTNPNVANAWLDSDGDGIHDALEMLFFGNLAGTAGGEDDANSNGIRDIFEIAGGKDPTADNTASGMGRENYSYDSLGRLTGAGDSSYSFDIEGNLESSN